MEVAPTSAPSPSPQTPAAAVTSAPIGSALARTLAAGGAIRVGVYGDSFGDGAWGALTRRGVRAQGIRLFRFSEQGSGLARGGDGDLLARTRSQLRSQAVDVAIVSLGANDTRGIVVRGRVAAFSSPAWRQAYGERVERLIGLLQSEGVQVYWMGLPRMRDPKRDRDLDAVQEVIQERLRRLNVPFLEARPLTSDREGRYAPYLADDAGRRRLMRAGDGVHMTGVGYDRLLEPLWKRVSGEIAAARAARASDAKARPV